MKEKGPNLRRMKVLKAARREKLKLSITPEGKEQKALMLPLLIVCRTYFGEGKKALVLQTVMPGIFI